MTTPSPAPSKWDVVDYLRAGGSLAVAVGQSISTPISTASAQTLAQFQVFSDQTFIFPGSRQPVQIKYDNVAAAHYAMTGQHLDPKATRLLTHQLIARCYSSPHELIYRRASSPTELWWRATGDGDCFHVDQGGVSVSPDPPGTVLGLAGADPWIPCGLNSAESSESIWELADRFQLSYAETQLMHCWLTAGMLGIQTPILLAKGPAGSGKTTLARLLVSVIEPLTPHLNFSKRNADERELVRTLQSSPALVLDNVSQMSPENEDTLSQLVTGFVRAVRTLYQDGVTLLRMYRALIITTTNWDPYKGDLADRILPIEPKVNDAAWFSERGMTEWAQTVVPRLRHFTMESCAVYYRQVPSLNGTSPWRLGDFGTVITALGYDAEELMKLARQQRADVIGRDDPTIEAIQSLWESRDEGVTDIKFTIQDLLGHLQQQGLREWSGIGLGRFLSEKRNIFVDRGFYINNDDRHSRQRYWTFSDQPRTEQKELL